MENKDHAEQNDRPRATGNSSIAPPVTSLPRKTRIAYLVTHPIQYQAPLLRLLSAQPDLELTVFFQSDLSAGSYFDTDFGRSILWDVPLLEGYRYEFLPALGRRDRLSAIQPLSYGIARRLLAERFDFLWIHGYSRWFHWTAMLAAKLAATRVLVRDDVTTISRPRSRLKVMLKRAVFFRALRALCDGFLATGSLNRDFYLQNAVAADRIFSMPNCVDNDYFANRAKLASTSREELRASLGLEPGRPVILFAGKFRSLKRAGDLIEALRIMRDKAGSPPRPYLLLVGDGALRQELEEAACLCAGDILFPGFRNQSEMPAFLDLCDVFVLSSEYETWGLAVNEAMSVGRAAIVSDRVGCGPDLIQNGVNGYIYPCGDVEALARCLSQVLQSPARITAMGRASLDIIANWSLQQDVEGLRACVAALAPGRAS